VVRVQRVVREIMIARVIKALFRRLLHLITFISGEGSWGLKKHEIIILDAVIEILDQQKKILVSKQLKQSFFVERIPDGRINVFRFYYKPDELKINSFEFNDLLFRVYISVDNERQVAFVTFYKGYIFSLELKNPSKYYYAKSINTYDVETGRSSESYTIEIDKEEH
jgi:hypothetical protein